jgi:hypothetical protein
MHTSTRILLLLAMIVAIVVGSWVLLSVNNLTPGIIYSIAWTIAVLIAARLLTAVGFGYNRFTARRGGEVPRGPADAGAALAELSALREQGLISAEEYDAKRAKVLERL